MPTPIPKCELFVLVRWMAIVFCGAPPPTSSRGSWCKGCQGRVVVARGRPGADKGQDILEANNAYDIIGCWRCVVSLKSSRAVLNALGGSSGAAPLGLVA